MSHYMFAYVITCSSPVSKKDQNYEATRLHFENLVKRYGHPVIILNLIKVVSIFLLFEGNDFIFFPHLSNVSNFLNKQFSCIFANILQKGGNLLVFFYFGKILKWLILVLFNQQSHERKPRESILRSEFGKAIDFINKDLSQENRLRFLHWDLKHFQRLVSFII